MRIASLSLLLVPLLVIFGLPDDRISAQQELREDAPRWRAECAAAVARLDSRPSDGRDAVLALQTLLNCERSAGSAVSAMWHARPSDEGVIRALAYTSRRMRDGRIMDAAIVVVEDTSSSGDLRMSALMVLAAYINPTISGMRENPEREHRIERYSVAGTAHALQTSGTVPLGDQHEAIILSVITRLAARGATDERLSGAAEELLRWFVPDPGEP